MIIEVKHINLSQAQDIYLTELHLQNQIQTILDSKVMFISFYLFIGILILF